MSEPATAVAAYQNFGLKADFDVEAGPAKNSNHEEAQAKIDAAPAAQKANPEIARDVLMAMMHDDVNNSLTFKNVRISAVDGRVTLTGQVKNGQQRAKLEVIVAGVVGSANVRDQLEIK